MASGFVPAGGGSDSQPEDAAWREARQAVEAARSQSDEEIQHGKPGESLYGILQANKAAKQEAFEESIRLKNQFRTLHEDEVEFLDSVLASTREKEEAVKKDTHAQLELFRQRQGREDEATEAEPDAKPSQDGPGSAVSPIDPVDWNQASKKRKKGPKPKPSKSMKMRRLSVDKPPSSNGTKEGVKFTHEAAREEILGQGHTRQLGARREALARSLGLDDYDSDDG